MDESLLLALFTAEEMRAVDAAGHRGLGIPGGHLMERAGVAVAREILERFDARGGRGLRRQGQQRRRRLRRRSRAVQRRLEVTVFAARRAATRTRATPGSTSRSPRGSAWTCAPRPASGASPKPMCSRSCRRRVDAIFGTGFTGVAKGPAAAAIELINEAPGAVVSVDIVRASTPAPARCAVRPCCADLTVTLHAPKVGHFVSPGGRARVTSWSCRSASRRPATSSPTSSPSPPRPSACSCGPRAPPTTSARSGTVLVVGGSRGMDGRGGHGGAGRLALGRRPRALRAARRPGRREALPEVINVAVPGARPARPRGAGRDPRRDGPPQGGRRRPRAGPRRRHGRSCSCASCSRSTGRS